MRGFTAIGEAVFLLAFGALIVWRLIAARRRREAAFFAVAALGGELLDQILKFFFQRPRPEAFFGVSPENYSFPSGHALESLCFYLVLAEIFLDKEWPRRRRFITRAAAVILAGLIGFSRVYLGVHYPTDVLAGYAAAIVWLTVLWSVYKVRRREG
jgi:undecaprenyl-diphosphatase